MTIVLLSAALFSGLGIMAAPTSAVPAHVAGAAVRGVTAYYSTNWAGYFSTNTAGHTNFSVTKSAGTWTQPTVNCASGKTAITSLWIGIDGATSNTVEQTGTSGTCVGGVASYDAWWELYPLNAEQPISTITVHAGDKIVASVTYSTTTNKFTMTIADGAHSFTKVATQKGTLRSSAECIVERPSNGQGVLFLLAKFSTAKFTTCTGTIHGVTGGIGSFPAVGSINMVSSVTSATLASTSVLSANKSTFTVTWKGYS